MVNSKNKVFFVMPNANYLDIQNNKDFDSIQVAVNTLGSASSIASLSTFGTVGSVSTTSGSIGSLGTSTTIGTAGSADV